MAITSQEIVDELTAVGERIDNAREAFTAQLTTLADRLAELVKAGDLSAIEAAVQQVKTDAEELAAAAVDGTSAGEA